MAFGGSDGDHVVVDGYGPAVFVEEAGYGAFARAGLGCEEESFANSRADDRRVDQEAAAAQQEPRQEDVEKRVYVRRDAFGVRVDGLNLHGGDGAAERYLRSPDVSVGEDCSDDLCVVGCLERPFAGWVFGGQGGAELCLGVVEGLDFRAFRERDDDDVGGERFPCVRRPY